MPVRKIGHSDDDNPLPAIERAACARQDCMADAQQTLESGTMKSSQAE